MSFKIVVSPTQKFVVHEGSSILLHKSNHTESTLLTTSLNKLSGMFLVELHKACAEEWEYITGASLTDKVSRAV